MPDLTLALDIRNVDRRVIADPHIDLRLSSASDGSPLKWSFALEGQAKTIVIPDAPAANPLTMRLTPSRYRDVASRVWVRDGGRLEPVAKELLAPRLPSEWLPAFTPWNALGPTFTTMARLLDASKVFQLGEGTTARRITGAVYDSIAPTDRVSARAKMAMLNICARLDAELAPGSARPWITRFESFLLGNHERLIGQTTQACADLVRDLRAHPVDGYEPAGSALHRRNFKKVLGVTDVGEMVSIKTSVARANLQLTVAMVRYHGAHAWMMDVDIDEHGHLLGHLFDLLVHQFTKGTDPIDIHEALRERFTGCDLGYDLTPRAPMGTVDVTLHGATT